MNILVGLNSWTVAIPSEKAVAVHRAPIADAPTTSPRERVRAALEAPFGFEPMRRALAPDDRVAIVFDADLPHAAELLAGVLDHLGAAGIAPAAATVVTPPGSRQDWIEVLPDEFADATAETHDPADRKKLAYLATTRTERRVYLNRTAVEADFVVVLSGRGYDPLTGYAGAEAALFPALADEGVRASFAGHLSAAAPGSEPWELRAEASEVAYLLGMPFLVQVIEGEGTAIHEVVAGLLVSSSRGIERQDARWRGTIADEPDTAVAAIGGPADRIRFLDLAKAAACAARAVQKGGRIALLTDAAPALGEGAELLRRFDSPKGAYKRLALLKPDDWAACHLWAFAAKRASLFLASGYPDDVAESLFATPFRTPSELQRLLDSAESVLTIPDAHKTMIEVK